MTRPPRALLWAALASLALAALWAWRAYDLGSLLTLDHLKASRDALQARVQAQPLATAALFFAVYVAAAALSIPGAVILTLAAGAMFGLGWGLLLVSFASSLGALLAFLVARYLLRDAVQSRFGKALAPINEGVRKDGTFYWVDSTIVPYVGAGGSVDRYISIRFDITRQKLAEARLIAAQAAAESANAAKSEFLANMSHEIRTPMTAILGFADLLAGDGDHDVAKRAEYVGTIRRNGEHLLAIINDILDISKI